MSASFLWYDLETFGQDPRRTRIAQFAAIRTDAELQPVGEPISLFCQPARDLLPSPGATMVTGITPQRALAEGLPEHEFMARLHEEFSQPGTCASGCARGAVGESFMRESLAGVFVRPEEKINGGCRNESARRSGPTSNSLDAEII